MTYNSLKVEEENMGEEFYFRVNGLHILSTFELAYTTTYLSPEGLIFIREPQRRFLKACYRGYDLVSSWPKIKFTIIECVFQTSSLRFSC